MDEKTKQDFIEIFKELDLEETVKAPLIAFVKSYDGTNVDDFKALLLQMIFMLMRYKELEIKERAFDRLEKDENELENKMQVLKGHYQDLLDDKDFPPSISYNPENHQE